MNQSLTLLRKTGLAEGVSFLVLLLIAMPLKYIWGIPEGVKYLGWAHGVLFVGFCGMALYYQQQHNKPFSWLVRAGLAAFVPLGTFIWEKWVSKEGNH